MKFLFRRARRKHELDQEIRAHFEMAVNDRVARGESRKDAERAARREFGNEDNVKEDVRAAWGGIWLDRLAQDVRFAFRSLLQARGVTFLVVLTLAIAIGANTAIFSVVESVLLAPLPYPNEDRIVRVAATVYESRAGRGDRGNVFSDSGYWHFFNNQRSFEKFGGYYGPEQLPLTGNGPPRQVGAGSMTLSAFEALGVFPELGRLPTQNEDAPGGPSVALLSHALWVSQYGADPTILGQTVDLNGAPREVIGVMPAGFDFMPYNGFTPEVDVWTPLQLDPASQNFGDHWIYPVARLRTGVTIEAATEDARSLVARFDEAGYGQDWFEGIYDGGAIVRPFHEFVVGETRERLLILLGTVGFVLLIACSNVANLLLVRAEGRRQESAVRMALGSGRGRLVRSVFVESAMLALTGGALGVLLAYAGTRMLISIEPLSIPRLDEIGIDGSALAFTAIVSVLAGLLFGVLPAVQSSSTQVMTAIRDGGRGATVGRHRLRTRNALVVTQVALAFVLVIGSGLMVRSFQALRSVDPGFATENVLTFTVHPLPTKYEDRTAVAQFISQLIERLEAVPGVTRAGAVNSLPLAYMCCNVTAVIDEFPPAEGEFPPLFRAHRATPGYFESMGIPVVEGRAFTVDDHERRLGSAIISRSVKDQYWPDTSALGKRINFFGVRTQVVGVVGDIHVLGLDVAADQVMYLPMLDAEGSNEGMMPLTEMAVTLRTAVEPLSLVETIRSALAEVDPDLPIANVRPMGRVLGDSVSTTSFTMSLLLIAAIIALFLGSVGIYGMLSYVVSQRTTEIGVRSALGATPRAVRQMIVSQGMRLAGIGVLFGLIAAVALGQVIAAQLYAVSPIDPVTIVAAAGLFLAVAAAASLVPAGLAARTAPVEALRVE